jgi:hypothetical protein
MNPRTRLRQDASFNCRTVVQPRTGAAAPAFPGSQAGACRGNRMKSRSPRALMTLADMLSIGVSGLAAVCVPALTSGCAPNLEALSPHAPTGKFDFLDCPSLSERIKWESTREGELAELMNRARTGVGGVR